MDIDNIDITELLHDARLLRIRWDANASSLAVVFDCLRQNIDGIAFTDRTVTLIFHAVERLGETCDVGWFAERPSTTKEHGVHALNDLVDMEINASDAYLIINSRQRYAVVSSIGWMDWLYSHVSNQANNVQSFVHLSWDIDQEGKRVDRILYIEYDSFTIRAGQQTLSLDEWAGQYAAWWKHWEDYWENNGEDGEEDGMDEFAALIPAGAPDMLASDYLPPDDDPFVLADTADIPEYLLTPVRDYLTAHHKRDWLLLAQVYPCLDSSLAERAIQLENNAVNDLGEWFYARGIAEWWQEGDRAFVALNGFLHTMPDDDEPADNHEAINSFALMKVDSRWVIYNYGIQYVMQDE
ncbi:MAG: hypothetical protein ACYDBB_25080 [Armatimonadota bacterium]